MSGTDTRNLMVWFFLAVFVISTVLLGWLLWPFASVIIMAMVVTGLFKPVYRYLTRKIKPGLASLLTCLLIFVVLFVPIVLFVGILSTEAYGLYQLGRDMAVSEQFQQVLQGSWALEKVNAWLAVVKIEISAEQLNSSLSQIGRVVGLYLYQQASAIASNILNFILQFFFMLLIIYFLLIDGERLISFIFDLSPLPADQEQKLVSKFKDMAGAILIINGLGGLIQGTCGGLVFYFFDLTSPFMWGVIMGLLAFLPIVGIGIVFMPAALYLFLTGRIAAGIFLWSSTSSCPVPWSIF